MNKTIAVNSDLLRKFSTPISILTIGLILFSVKYIDSPSYQAYLNRDSGVFHYIGWEILKGKIPYHDVWDHKPPLIFYINALGLLLSKKSNWGVWILQYLSLFFSGLISLKLLSNLWGKKIALLATILWIICLRGLLEGGNHASEYGILLQFLFLYLFVKRDDSPNKTAIGIAMGLLSGFLLILKPNLIGVTITVILYYGYQMIILPDFKSLVRKIIPILVGIAVILFIFGVYLAVNKALFDFWDAVIKFNTIYVDVDPRNILVSIIGSLYSLMPSGFSFFSMTGWAFAIYIITRKKFTENLHKSQKEILVFLIINFIIEVISSGISGRIYYHYYLSVIPVFANLSAFTFSRVSSLLDQIPQFSKGFSVFRIIFSCLIFIPFLLNAQYKNLYPLIQEDKIPTNQQELEIVRYIEENSEIDDTVLVLGAETTINFLSKRSSPTKYVYQYPLIKEEYTKESMIVNFLSDINKNHPKIIIDTTTTNDEFRYGDSGSVTSFYNSTNFLSAFYSNEYFTNSCYFEMEKNHWSIYLCNQ